MIYQYSLFGWKNVFFKFSNGKRNQQYGQKENTINFISRIKFYNNKRFDSIGIIIC